MNKGLLDFVSTPEGQGLLSAAFGGLAGARRGQPINSLGRAGLAGLAGYAGAQDRITQTAESEAQRKFRDVQMRGLESQMAKQVAQDQWKAGLPAAMAQAQPTYGAGDEGPTMKPGNPDALRNYAMLPNSPFADDLLKAQIMPKAPEYKTVGDNLISIGPDNKVTPVFTATPKPESAPSAVKEYQFAVQNDGYKGSFQQFQTDLKRAGATKIEVNSGQKDVQWGTPPKDMVWARDQRGNVITQPDAKTGAFSPMAIPIGGSAIEAGNLADADKARQRVAAAKTSTANVISAIEGAEKLVGGTTAGLGSVASVIPGTSARDLSAQLETVKANLGFDRLQQMRDMSPTGGALGSVAVQELTALQSTVASLDQAQSPAQLKSNIAKAKKHYNNWLEIMEGKMPETGNKDKNPPAGPAPFADPSKEQRYQEWLRSQGGKR